MASEHKADTFGIAFGTRRLAEGIIGGLHDLAEHVGADVREGDTPEAVIARIRNRVYKDTSCGCSVAFIPGSNGEGVFQVFVQGYCEGTDSLFPPHGITFPCATERWDKCVTDADADGQEAWNETHGCEGCGDVDPETGWRHVNPECPNCGGQGVIL